MPARQTSGGSLLLVMAAVVSVQFGGAVAATLVPVIGAAGSVVLRLGIGAVVLLAVARPTLRGHSASAWRTVVLFGLVLGAMNWSFYASLDRLHIGVAVTIEFIGPLTLAAVQSRRVRDLLAVAAAAAGILLISQALTVPWGDLDLIGIGLALLAGTFWAGYIVLSQRTGAAFPGLNGLALAMIVALALVLPFGIWSVPLWTGDVLVKGAAVAILSSVLPYSLELLALRQLSQRVFGILLSLEPAVAALAGLIVLGQRLTPTQLVGMALVVVASGLVMGAGGRHTPADGAAT
ncbi:MAG: EamA family transporter [Actinomycetales bacterium]|jgi:inner membrane transporter RhtA|uniref:EamA family transporter n=1 Tax=Candidatus Phosphoribacter hodrii TaxID=2953743 RepID=A0A935IMZ7_9MICO|nr:EamA family transporter [Candidatus Phosphoribacter hodrii]HOA03263.1 EamA family transporter [Dermatophilaceae bacterium]MBL0002798.1 EamA family transporter [Candidatus Phosphoribacter hodrii]HOF37305.1 EamA family transporter [Dermatophilaceae bacterium]HOR16636.1 EamA family transporter [Dermatophilaceae bacterium]